MLTVKEKRISGHLVMVNELPARHKLPLAVKVLKFVPPILRSLKEILMSLLSGDNGGVDLNNIETILDEDSNFDVMKALQSIDMVSISELLENLLNIYTPDEILKFCEDVLVMTVIDGNNASEMLKSGYTGVDVFKDDFPLLIASVIFTIQANSFFGKGGTGSPLKAIKEMLATNRNG